MKTTTTPKSSRITERGRFVATRVERIALTSEECSRLEATRSGWRRRAGERVATLLSRQLLAQDPIADAEFAALTAEERAAFCAELERMRERPDLW